MNCGSSLSNASEKQSKRERRRGKMRRTRGYERSGWKAPMWRAQQRQREIGLAELGRRYKHLKRTVIELRSEISVLQSRLTDAAK
jgi:predicted RNase H-like nuclease (RuvC/YqgF family)